MTFLRINVHMLQLAVVLYSLLMSGLQLKYSLYICVYYQSLLESLLQNDQIISPTQML